MATTAEQWQQRAIDETGGTSQNAEFEVAIAYGTTGGVLGAEFNGFEIEPVAYPCSAAALQAALESLPSIQAGGCKVVGPIGGPFTIEMTGGNAGQPVPPLVIDGTMLEPSQEVEVEPVQDGATNDYSTKAAQYWEDHSTAGSTKLRFLLTKIDLINLRLGNSVDDVDTRTGQVNLLERKGSQRGAALERMLARVQREIDVEVKTINAGALRTSGGVMTTTTPNGLPYGVMARRIDNGRIR